MSSDTDKKRDSAAYEAAMIANFNAKVNAVDVEQGELESEPAKPVTVNEVGGPKGLEPTRYGDWEAKGRCYDF